jgi:hypothetical protein
MSKLGNVKISKNSAAAVGARALVNLIEGANVTLTVADNPATDEIDVTVASAAAGGSIVVRKNSGADVGTRPRLNFIEGANITLTVVDDGVDSEVDITIASAGGASVVWLDQFFPYPQGDSHKGAYAAGLMEDGYQSIVYQTIYIPDDINTIDTAVVIVIPEGTGNLYWQCDSAASAACGEDYETHTDSIGATATGVTTDEVECIDISAALTNATGGDLCGLQFIRNGNHANDTVNADVYYIGILIRGSV